MVLLTLLSHTNAETTQYKNRTFPSFCGLWEWFPPPKASLWFIYQTISKLYSEENYHWSSRKHTENNLRLLYAINNSIHTDDNTIVPLVMEIVELVPLIILSTKSDWSYTVIYLEQLGVIASNSKDRVHSTFKANWSLAISNSSLPISFFVDT